MTNIKISIGVTLIWVGKEDENKEFTKNAKSIGNMSALSWDICPSTCIMLIFTPFCISEII